MKARKSAKSRAPSEKLDADRVSFRIVGISASAGGLEAFEKFFRLMPLDSGLAFVLAPHLAPDHASLFTEILQRSTTMPVLEAQDQVQATANTAYIIPPNRDMSIFHGKLQLCVRDTSRGQRLPIDAFLSSLAEDQGENAVGIILSGAGADGAQGLRAIVEAGGVTNEIVRPCFPPHLPGSAGREGKTQGSCAMPQTANTELAVIGIDIGKNTVHVIGLNKRGAIVLKQKWPRTQIEARLANVPPCLIGMEACVGAHDIARRLKALGHDARLMPARYVRAYSKGQKNDFKDAEAIAEAPPRPTMRFVAIKLMA